MKQKLPGILFLLCIPASIAVFLWISSISQSEILGLLVAVLLYMLLGVGISIFSFRREAKALKEMKKNENTTEET